MDQRLHTLILRTPLYGAQAFAQPLYGLMVGAVDDGLFPV